MVELALKFIGAPQHFIKSKAEIFDAVVVVTSWSLLLVLGDPAGGHAEDTVALIVLLRLWRLPRDHDRVVE